MRSVVRVFFGLALASSAHPAPTPSNPQETLETLLLALNPAATTRSRSKPRSSTPALFAENGVLTPCADSKPFQERLEKAVQKDTDRLSKYEAGSPAYIAIQDKVKRTEARFAKYGKQGLLCGDDGRPRLIVDGRWDHGAEIYLPALFFLYTAGWIGWSGRSYQAYTKTTDNPIEKEIIIDVPKAAGIMLSGYKWPIAAWDELVRGELVVPDEEPLVGQRGTGRGFS